LGLIAGVTDGHPAFAIGRQVVRQIMLARCLTVWYQKASIGGVAVAVGTLNLRALVVTALQAPRASYDVVFKPIRCREIKGRTLSIRASHGGGLRLACGEAKEDRSEGAKVQNYIYLDRGNRGCKACR
jgi:hypothetical protein